MIDKERGDGCDGGHYETQEGNGIKGMACSGVVLCYCHCTVVCLRGFGRYW